MIESDNVTDNLVFEVNSLITLYQIRHFYLLTKWGYIVMLRARMFRSLIPVLMIKERNIRARNITI